MKEKFLHFSVDRSHLVLPIQIVIQVVVMVEVETLPGAPGAIRGIIRYKGEVIPVYNLRKRFQLEIRDPQITDQLIIVQTRNKQVALWVDQCFSLLELGEEEIVVIPSLASTKYIRAIIQKDDHLFLIQDIDQFLEEEEVIALESLILSSKSPQ